MWLIIAMAVGAICVYFGLLKPLNYWKDKGIPYAKPTIFLGSMGNNIFRKRALAELLQDLYNEFPDKRYFGFHQFTTPTLMLRDPELIKKITVKDFDSFVDHQPFFPENADPLWNKNLFAMTGDNWRDMRATLSPAFTSSKMRAMFGLMSNCAEQFTRHFLDKKETVTVEMKDIFSRFANDVIASSAFGVTCDSLKYPDNEFYLKGRDATDVSGLKGLRFFFNAMSPTLAKLINVNVFDEPVQKFFTGIVNDSVRAREEKAIVRPDMIHLLMEARKGRLKHDDQTSGVTDTGFAVVEESHIGKTEKRQRAEITNDDITANGLLFFFAGFDTASMLMSLMSYEVALNVDVQEKLQAEIDNALNDNEGKFTYETILGMKYLDMTVSETLRKWPPPILTDRKVTRPYTIEPQNPGEVPLKLDVGTLIWIPFYPIQRDPKYYPNPEKFDPERFSDANKDKVTPFSYLPFGVGPRSCIGSRFGLLEVKTVMVHLLSKFEIVPVKETEIPLVLSKKGFNLISDKGFMLGLKPRKINN